MRRRLTRLPLALLVLIQGCSGAQNTLLAPGAPSQGSAPVRWRVDAACIGDPRTPADGGHEALARACHDTTAHDLITVSLSGGGVKAAVFGGETLFYLQALGLLQATSAISSVSGGSYASSLYALSCDPGDAACATPLPNGLRRPAWAHDAIMETLGQGYRPLVYEQVARWLVPVVPATISAKRFGDVIDRRFLGGQGTDGNRFTFADLNPRRPQLLLNATITSNSRVGQEDTPTDRGCLSGQGKGYLRRRTSDELFHFAFSDYYFGLMHTALATYPLAAGIAASSAFPALIDNAELTDGCDGGSTIKLMDGGANDNQALIEVYAIITELAMGQHRSDLWTTRPDALELLDPGDQAWALTVNSSVTEGTGVPSKPSPNYPGGLAMFLKRALQKSLLGVDVYSAEGYALRRQAYVTEKALRDVAAMAAGRAAPVVRLVEIALTELDQYPDGGAEAELRHKAGLEGLDGGDIDIGQRIAAWRRDTQRAAYTAIAGHALVRKALRLSNLTPQCYFDISEELDKSLISVSPEDQACLRDAARWATALRAQEMCVAGNDPKTRAPGSLTCRNHVVELSMPAALGDAANDQRDHELCIKRIKLDPPRCQVLTTPP